MIRILLNDKDKEYGIALANAISNLHNEFEIRILNSNKNQLDKGELSFDSFDLCLFGGYSCEEIEAFQFHHFEKNKVVILTENQSESITKQSKNQEDHFWYLYKYVSVDNITTDLNYLIGFVTGKKNFMRKSLHTNMIGFYSMSGGVGKTALSIGTSRELSRYHDKKILYISFEEMPATELFLQNNLKNRNLGDYLYFLLERKNETLCSHLEGFTLSDAFGVEAFLPSKGRNDLNCLSKDELFYFIKVLSDSCRYDYIIFDLKCDLSDETLFLLEQCCKIVLVQNDSPVSDYKNSKLISYLSKINSLHFPEGYFCVVNRGNGFEGEKSTEDYDNANLNNLRKIYIEKDENSFRFKENIMEININHVFGVGIKQIAEEILSSENGEKQNKSFFTPTGSVHD